MKLAIDVREEPESVILNVSGEVDMETSPQLRDQIKKTLKKKPKALKDVPYIDSSGIAVLIEGMKWSKKRDVPFALVDISDGVRDVLQMSKLLPVFTVEG